MAIDKRINYKVQGKIKNYLGNQKTVKAPLHWQSAPNHPTTELAYITKKEKDLLIKKDLHKSLKGGVNRGPSGIISLNGWGSIEGGKDVGMSGAATSAAETGGGSGADAKELAVESQRVRKGPALPPGVVDKSIQDYRSAAIAAGAGQNVNPGWFGPRNRPGISRQDLRAAKAFAPKAYRATRGSPFGIGNLFRGAMGMFGGIPGKLISGLSAARNWAKRTGQNIGELGERDEEGNPLYPNLMSYLNRNKEPDTSELNNLDSSTDGVNPDYYNDLDNELMLSTQGDTNRFQNTNITGGTDVNDFQGVNYNDQRPGTLAGNEPLPEILPFSAAQGGRAGYQGGELVEQQTDFIEGPQGADEFQETVVEGQEQPSQEQLEALAMEIFQLPLEELDEEQLLVVYQEAMQGQPMEEAVQEDVQFAANGGLAGLL